jgi:hypothetical protein
MMAILVPGVAQADFVDQTVNWSGAAFEGGEPFYNNNQVTAYVEGSTAKVQFVFHNNSPMNITARPYIDMDWGTRYYGAAVNIPSGQPATMYIEFTVPTVAAAGGLVEHGYGIGVQYEQQGMPFVMNRAVGESWTAPGGDDTYDLSNTPVIDTSVVVWREDGAGWEWINPDDYTVDAWTGEVDFDATPDPGTEFLFTYDYYMDAGDGDGVTTVFMVIPPFMAEMKSGTLKVYLANNADEEVDGPHLTGWTYDARSGQLTFDTAPTPNQTVLVRFEFWMKWADMYWSAFANRTFVIYGQDQADAMTLDRRYIETRATQMLGGFDSASARVLWGEAEAARAKGELEYREGKFTAAEASLQIAVDKINASIAAEAAWLSGWETRMVAESEAGIARDQAYAQEAAADAAYTQGQVANLAKQGAYTDAETAQLIAETAGMEKNGTYLEAQTASLNAQTARLNALTEAEKDALKASNSRERSYGTFVILIGVFLVIVAVAILLLAVGMFLKWRKPAAGST